VFVPQYDTAVGPFQMPTSQFGTLSHISFDTATNADCFRHLLETYAYLFI